MCADEADSLEAVQERSELIAEVLEDNTGRRRGNSTWLTDEVVLVAFGVAYRWMTVTQLAPACEDAGVLSRPLPKR